MASVVLVVVESVVVVVGVVEIVVVVVAAVAVVVDIQNSPVDQYTYIVVATESNEQ